MAQAGGKAPLSCHRDGSPVTVIVMCAWLAVTGVPPAAHCRKTDLFAIARHGNGKQVGLKAGKNKESQK